MVMLVRSRSLRRYSRSGQGDRPHLAALADMVHTPYWLDGGSRPEPAAKLTRDISTDLLIIGGGYTGLWGALRAKERDPALDVVLVESRECGWAASGRNGGFCASSLTHGVDHGYQRFPAELAELERLGLRNLDEIEKTIHSYDIDCDFERTGELEVAVADWQLDSLREAAQVAERHGHAIGVLDAEQVRAEVDSPTYTGALWMRDSVALLDPARLAWGLRAACVRAGVRLYENTPVDRLDDAHAGVVARTPYAAVRARRVLLATNGFPPLLKRLRNYVVPMYDHVLATEPLTSEQLAAIGWRNRQGISDAANQFHYYRLTADNRIIWGGYDAVYHFGGAVRDELDTRPETFAKLAEHFFTTFPQLEGVRFTHGWGGVIDMCSRLCPFVGTARDGRIAYALGYSGLGVGATRFTAGAALDLLTGHRGAGAETGLLRTRPRPLPPEPLRWAGIQLTRWSLARADRAAGRRNWWLRGLRRLGIG